MTKINFKNKLARATMIAGLFSVLLISMTPINGVHAQSAPETSFQSGGKTMQSPVPLTPNSGQITCNYHVDPNNPCSGYAYSGGLLAGTYLTTPSTTWNPHFCGSTSCVDAGWHTDSYPRSVFVGGKTYNFDHGEMYACTPTQCSYPVWTWGGITGTTTAILNVPVSTSVIIHAFYFYTAADGTQDLLTVDQSLPQGYL